MLGGVTFEGKEGKVKSLPSTQLLPSQTRRAKTPQTNTKTNAKRGGEQKSIAELVVPEAQKLDNEKVQTSKAEVDVMKLMVIAQEQ